jgi:hypothetical protein
MSPLRSLSFLFCAAVIVAPGLRAQEETDKSTPVPMAKALKLGVEKLTEVTGESEAGIDRAAGLYAIAKKLETELALAKTDVERVMELEAWRDTLSLCRQSCFSLAYIINGGGTMYSHAGARDAAEVEDFLAGFSKRLPLSEGKGDPAATKMITEAMAHLKTLKPFESGEAEQDKEARKNLTEEVKRATEFWETLKYMSENIPAEDAKAVATFATSALSWLKDAAETPEEEKKAE